MGSELFIEMEKKNIPAEYIKLYSLTGITCSGCMTSVSSLLLKVEGVTFVSINTDFSEVLVVSSAPVALSKLREAIAYDAKYQLTESDI